MAGSHNKFFLDHIPSLLSRWLKGIVFFAAFGLNACGDGQPHQGSVLREAQKRGILRVVTLNSPTTYYEDRSGATGFEYDLASAYAAHLGLELNIVVEPTIAAVLHAIKEDRADIAAAGLSITTERNKTSRFGPVYLQVKTRVVCARKGAKPQALADLASTDLRIAQGSAYVEVLRSVQHQVPGLQFEVVEGASVEALMAQIAKRGGFCTLTDSHVFDLHQRYLPALVSPMALAEAQEIAWGLGGGQTWRSASLQRDVAAWFAQKDTVARISALNELYFRVPDAAFDYVDIARFRRAIKSRLPLYQELFEKAGKRYDLPWELFAALSWRESHWQPEARSKTGVRGMMMLTRVTAREAGVNNRLDPAQSIAGGTRYFAQLLRRLPDSVYEEDRNWFALLAYNMGYAHMTDARVLAARRGLDPDRWRDVRTVLADMEDSKVYTELSHGYARGRQGRDYVAAVRDFYDILRQNTQMQLQP